MKPLPVAAALALLAPAAALTLWAPAAAAQPVQIVAAENFYGDVAQQIGGARVAVTSILRNPAADPHLFEASPSSARALAAARLVIYNGAGYDPWITPLLGAADASRRKVIEVAALVGRKPGQNPHIWYDPHTMAVLAGSVARDLTGLDAPHSAGYRRRLARFRASLRPLLSRIAALRSRFAGLPVAATEPVLGYLLAALGMRVRDRGFQIAVMNNTEPSAAEIAGLEGDLRHHRVAMLVSNSQVSDPLATRLGELATAAHIPLIAASETEPPGKTYQAWLMGELDAITTALARSGR